MVKSGGNAWNETGPQMSRESKAGAPRESGWATALLPQCALFHKCELGDKPDQGRSQNHNNGMHWKNTLGKSFSTEGNEALAHQSHI